MKTFLRGTLTAGLLAAAAAISAATMNLGARIVFESDDFQRKHKNGIRVVEYAINQRSDIYGEDSEILPHPYMLYVNKPNLFGRGFRQTDERGYRIVKQLPHQPGERQRRVLVLGGSTTYSYPYVANPDDAWPSQLQKKLGPRFEVINAGLGSATSAELLAGYAFRHRYLKPDIVIVHEGGNDVLAMMFEHYDPEYTHYRRQGTRPVPGPIDHAILRWGGWPAKIFYAHNWNTLATVFTPAPSSLELIPAFDALTRATNAPITGFERNIDLLAQMIQADGAIPVLFGFVQAREALLSRNRPDLIGKERAFTIGLERNLSAMKRIAAARHVDYIDPDAFHRDDDWFLDNCHLNETGEAAKASFVAKALAGFIGRADRPNRE